MTYYDVYKGLDGLLNQGQNDTTAFTKANRTTPENTTMKLPGILNHSKSSNYVSGEEIQNSLEGLNNESNFLSENSQNSSFNI